jgi:NTE family protein
MTSLRNDSPTRAVVLGRGGAFGVGWQIGLLKGLREAGVDAAGAEAIVGTSAGALVGVRATLSADVWYPSGGYYPIWAWRMAPA